MTRRKVIVMVVSECAGAVAGIIWALLNPHPATPNASDNKAASAALDPGLRRLIGRCS
jgi:hypothetical protein